MHRSYNSLEGHEFSSQLVQPYGEDKSLSVTPTLVAGSAAQVFFQSGHTGDTHSGTLACVESLSESVRLFDREL